MADPVTIVEEPRGATYIALLHFALQRGWLFSLVWRDQLNFSSSAALVAQRLQPDLVVERHCAEWPGTQLTGHVATVRLYRLSPPAVSTLAEAGGLYAWLAPDRPEDLAFYVADGRPWLGSIAHERDAFLHPEEIDVQALAAIGGLRLEGVGGE